jgi:hypothetical protein
VLVATVDLLLVEETIDLAALRRLVDRHAAARL